ncbi:hypothetical protein ESA94_00460 [Lacibacter luteus]|uniref:Uncharacterized protein n=1 Tax=Lacibacter luteus TaxID=2508719 RepID=A0A4Q1CKN8_9BACT|nr:hypothetical protein [Lacibacter luteus]RXK61527.1 hypothetical protein ESA94_00460 [Lacibacter luteus]
MFTYELLEAGCYYLIQEKEEEPIKLIKLHFKSDYAVCTSSFAEGEEIVWKKKADPILDIVECLDDQAVAAWEKLYYSQDAYYEEDDEE